MQMLRVLQECENEDARKVVSASYNSKIYDDIRKVLDAVSSELRSIVCQLEEIFQTFSRSMRSNVTRTKAI